MFSSPVAQAQVCSAQALSQLGAAERRRKPVRPAQTPAPPHANGAAHGCNANAGNLHNKHSPRSHQPALPSTTPHPSKAYGAYSKHRHLNARERRHTLAVRHAAQRGRRHKLGIRVQVAAPLRGNHWNLTAPTASTYARRGERAHTLCIGP
jgi:hypothetical protein